MLLFLLCGLPEELVRPTEASGDGNALEDGRRVGRLAEHSSNGDPSANAGWTLRMHRCQACRAFLASLQEWMRWRACL